MVGQPPFIKRCSRFPHSVENLEDEFCTPSRRIHRKWGRAYELSVSSYEALLTTEKAAKQIVDFVKFYQFDEDKDDENDKEEEEEEEEDRRFNHDSMLVWLSKDVFITSSGDYWASRDEQPPVSPARGAYKVFSLTFFEYGGGLWIVQQEPSLPAAEVEVAPAIESIRPSCPVLVDHHQCEFDGMNLLLRLLAKSKAYAMVIMEAKTSTANNDDDDDGDGSIEFPASLDAFKAFASEPWFPRTICLQLAGLSQVQWNTITAHCNKHVTISIDYNKETSDKSSFLETAIHNHCPAGLDLLGFQKAPADKRQLILEALESSTFLERLSVVFESWNKEALLSCMRAISWNRSLKELNLNLHDDERVHPQDDPLTLEEWELVFCHAIASHPTLQDVEVGFGDEGSRYRILRASPKSDDILIKMVSQNTCLVTFCLDEQLLYGEYDFYSVIEPVLDVNRLRPVVQAIKQETDIDHRQQLFTATLLSNNILEHPAHRYLLLKENIDLLKQPSFIVEEILLSDWNVALRDLASVEKRMQSIKNRMWDAGVAIPPKTSDMHGRKPKRSRSS